MEIPGLRRGMALKLMYYYIARNESAQRSHTKAWLARHEKVAALLL
jgi:hypothetical protein